MKNLAHSASFHFAVKSAPSNSGIKQLGQSQGSAGAPLHG
jgi:hypothetical protein